MGTAIRAVVGAMIGSGVFVLIAWQIFLRTLGDMGNEENVEHNAALIGSLAGLLGGFVGMVAGVWLGRRPAGRDASHPDATA
jgi:hypothetical protein